MKNLKFLVILSIVIFFGFLLKDYFYDADTVSTTKYNNGGSVDIGITFLNPDEDDEQYWMFKMFVDTHSVNLEEYNYQDIISVSVDSTKILKDNIEVESSGSGHHLIHYIKIPKVINNNLVISSENKILKIEIKNLSEVESRLIEFELKDYSLNYGEFNE